MTGSQYKNIIQWTLWFHPELASSDSMTVARTVFHNLGVAFPQGEYGQILEILETDDFLGWRSCSFEDAQRYADVGIAAIGMTAEQVVLLLPDKKMGNLSAWEELSRMENAHIRHTADLMQEEWKKMRFWAYNYGYTF